MDGRFSEFIGADTDGTLAVERCSVRDLVRQYGSPLYVTSEAQIRHNYRRIERAFGDRYRGNDVVILQAIKANNNLAIRNILHQEGAGGDCFGLGELWAMFAGGADPDKVVLNGSNKSGEELREGVRLGVTVTVDCIEELELLEAVCRESGHAARIQMRLKPRLQGLEGTFGMFSDSVDVARVVETWKWGMTLEEAAAAVQRAQKMPRVDLRGLHCHIGRQTADEEPFRAQVRAVVAQAAALREATGWTARVLDLGGGFPHGRDPEGRQPQAHVPPIEAFAEAVVSSLEAELERHRFPAPVLEFEPGRALIGNTTVLVGTVGVVKRTPALGRVWVNVDYSTNQLSRVMSRSDYYHFVAAGKLNEPAVEEADVVGPLCMPDVLGRRRLLPRMERGDLLAALDAGMYAETTSSQYNGQPRPATVLVSGARSDVIKARETVDDVFRTQRLPERFAGGREGTREK